MALGGKELSDGEESSWLGQAFAVIVHKVGDTGGPELASVVATAHVFAIIVVGTSAPSDDCPDPAPSGSATCRMCSALERCAFRSRSGWEAADARYPSSTEQWSVRASGSGLCSALKRRSPDRPQHSFEKK